MNLINIQKNTAVAFSALLRKLRSKSRAAPSFDEITVEVEAVRTRRYEK